MLKQTGKLLLSLATIVALVSIGLLGLLYVEQESILFAGQPLPADHRFDFDVPFEEIDIEVEGATLNALHFQQENPHGLIFFLHGNGGNLQSWTSNADYYRRINYDMFMLDYRGYGKSSGSISSEAQLHEDVKTAWDQVAPQYAQKTIIVYGRSLGSALAARLASRVSADLLILVSPFTSITAMAKQHYPYAPAALVRYPLRTDTFIADVEAPVLILHGTRDRLIPVQHGEQLSTLAMNAEFLAIEGAGHNDIHEYPAYIERLDSALTLLALEQRR